jgi:hypothetical protein
MSDSDPMFVFTYFFLKCVVLLLVGLALTALIYMTYNWSLVEVFKVRVRVADKK